jgi:hypothetical protein
MKYYVAKYDTSTSTSTVSPLQDLAPEVLYSSPTDQPNDKPFRYFFYDNQKVSVRIENMALHSKRIYLRNLYLFRDYLPSNYDFKYMDLTKIAASTFPSLVFAVNYQNCVLTITPTVTLTLSYKIFDYGGIPAISSNTLSLTPVVGSTFALAANFTPLPLCDPSGGVSMKYQASTNTCIAITTCNKSSLNTNYCYDENAPLQCLSGYYTSKIFLFLIYYRP